MADGLSLHLSSQKTSKMKPNRGHQQNLEIDDFALIYYTLVTFRGAENRHFSMLFWSPLLGRLLEPTFVFVAHFWGPFGKPFWSLLGYHFCIDF